MNTDWTQVKCYSFPLKGMIDPSEIMQVVKQLNIKKYTYEIRCDNITIKFGMSDAETTQLGERMYRQIGHLDSWGSSKIHGQNGDEFLDTNEIFKNLYNRSMDHNNIVIYIWDFDNYPFVTINSSMEINNAECELIESYTNTYGELPIGNIDDGNLFRKKSAPLKSVFERMFE
jgi:hypothetical protein